MHPLLEHFQAPLFNQMLSIVDSFTASTPTSDYAMAVKLVSQSDPGDTATNPNYRVLFSGPNGSEHTENRAPYVLNGER